MGESAAAYFDALFSNAAARGFAVPTGEIIPDEPVVEPVEPAAPAEHVGPSAAYFDELRFCMERQGVTLPAANLAIRHF